MAEITIISTCPTCGEIRFPSSKARINVYKDGTNRLTFLCPECGLRVIQTLEDNQYLRLFNRVARVYTNPPLEVLEVKPGGWPIQDNDVNDFLMDLAAYSPERIIREAVNADRT